MIDRRGLLTLAVMAAIALPLPANGQQRIPTIGFFGPPPSAGGLVQAFQQGLSDLGYADGRNIRIVYRYTDVALQGHPELFPRLAAELVELKPEVLVVSITEAALAAKAATSMIPIVTVSVPDPVAAGLASSLAKPGGNVTGLMRESRDLIGKNLELLKEILPGAGTIGVLVSPTEPIKSAVMADARDAGRRLGLRLRFFEAQSTEIESTFSTLRSEKISGVLVLGGGGFYLKREQIAQLALHKHLPSVFQNREFVDAGGLLSYAPSTVANYRRAAVFVDKILKGARPADLPIEQPTQFELIVNLKTARALQLTLPHAVLLRADEVIQ